MLPQTGQDYHKYHTPPNECYFLANWKQTLICFHGTFNIQLGYLVPWSVKFATNGYFGQDVQNVTFGIKLLDAYA